MSEEELRPVHERIKVVNKYKHEPTDSDVYIGRGSIFGSPFSHMAESKFKVTIVPTREEAVEKYKEYFDSIVDSCGCAHKTFKAKLRAMIVTLKIGGEVNLVCYCKPKACHGDVIRDYILTQV